MTDLEALLTVRSLISDPARWIKGALAHADDGRKVSVTHPHATRFSLDGAFFRVYHFTHSKSIPAVYDLIKTIVDPRRVVSIDRFNNALGTTHHAVLLKLDEAIISLGGTPPIEEEE